MEKEVTKKKYGNSTVFIETETLSNGNKKITSNISNSVLTEEYDNIKLKYVLFPKELLTLEEFFKIIVGERFSEKKDVVMELYSDYKQMRHCKSIDELMQYANWASHFIPNTYFKWHDKSLENIRCCQWMVFDFELKKSNGQAFIPAEVYEIFNQKVNFAPTIIRPSKTHGHYHVFLKHTPINGSTESTYLFARIQKKIAETIGTDLGAIGANHSFAIPKKDQKIFYFGDNTIDFNDLKNWWIDRIKEENKKVKYESKNNGKVTSLTEHMIWNHPAILALMNHEYDGSRNEVGFTLALLFYALGKDKEECRSFLMGDWYAKASSDKKKQPYQESEVKASIKSAYSGKYGGPSKEKIEALTGIEFNIKVYRGQKKRTKLHNKSENREAIINYFRERGGEIEMLKKELIEDICETQKSPLGKSFAFDSIKRNLDKLKKEGVIEWEKSGHGRNASTIAFKLNDNIVQNETIIEEDFTVYSYGKAVNQ